MHFPQNCEVRARPGQNRKIPAKVGPRIVAFAECGSNDPALAQPGDRRRVVAEFPQNSSVCWPWSGVGRSSLRLREGAHMDRLADDVEVPSFGWSTGRRIPRCWTCGSAKTWSIVLIGPHGTPALFSRSTQ